MTYFVTLSLLLLGVIHLLPAIGVSGNDCLLSLYGIAIDDPNVSILMRHRAVLFGLLGAFLVVAAFVPALQLLAFIAAFISLASFLCVAWSVGGYNTKLGRVARIDIAAVAILVVGFGAYAMQRWG